MATVSRPTAVTNALSEARIVEGTATPTLPYGLKPAPARPAQYLKIDLGDYDPEFAGHIIVVERDLPIEIEEMAARASDEDLTRLERIEAQYRFLEAILLAWNFTEELPSGDVVALPQPRDGGVRKLRVSQTKSLIAAFNKAYAADPNS